MTWQNEDKESSGSEQSPTMNTVPTPCPDFNGVKANLKKERQATSTGNYSSPCVKRNLSEEFAQCLEEPHTGSYPEAIQQPNMYGKKKLESLTRNSNLDKNPYNVMHQMTGTVSGRMLVRELSMEYPRKSVFFLTGLSEALVLTTRNQLEWSDVAMFTGVQLVLESQGQLGKKLVWTLTLKTQGRSGGADIEITKQLLSMNFEVASTSATCYAGWTGIQSLWKLKGGQ